MNILPRGSLRWLRCQGPNLVEELSSNQPFELRLLLSRLEQHGEEVTNLWYSEIENYKYGDNVQMECGHFTQVVWKDTKKAGFGRAYTKDGRKIYVVGRYHPPGNYQGCCKLNVPRPIN
ncbi:hypothetical protein CRM22_006301 [Opisthorchis felineus]|uniref:SCP domain-containing protein n=1 Tax=Opisthorchis felineus TaxID=147828 RepID=A0A4S2LLV4_OPIFE|nr:hypothetical protein CRM22_006301 [Opisthorchis felineus]